jgi:hypothetical protein
MTVTTHRHMRRVALNDAQAERAITYFYCSEVPSTLLSSANFCSDALHLFDARRFATAVHLACDNLIAFV